MAVPYPARLVKTMIVRDINRPILHGSDTIRCSNSLISISLDMFHLAHSSARRKTLNRRVTTMNILIQKLSILINRRPHVGDQNIHTSIRIIDGREEAIRGHGSREMPIWGTEFRAAAGRGNPGAESAVRGRILELIYYLQSIQEK